MKIEDIRDVALQQWVEDYTTQKVEAARVAKKPEKIEALRDVWKNFREADWEAWRELQDLRPRARAVLEKDGRSGQEALDLLLQRKLAALPRQGNYAAPYSLGFEVRVLREVLGEEDPPRRVEVTDFNP